MKKLFSSLLVLSSVCSAFTLVGCKGGNSDEGNATTKVVKIWVHKSEAEDEGMVYSAIADLFNEAGYKTADGTKDLKVKLEFKNSSDTLSTSIQAEILSGGLPDIVAVDSPNIAAYADTQILADISSYVTEEEKMPMDICSLRKMFYEDKALKEEEN